jgi:hypothetical protein
MKLFAISLIEDAKIWIDAYPKGNIKNPEELERAFKIRLCNDEHTQNSYSQYLDICKASRALGISVIGSIFSSKRSNPN